MNFWISKNALKGVIEKIQLKIVILKFWNSSWSSLISKKCSDIKLISSLRYLENDHAFEFSQRYYVELILFDSLPRISKISLKKRASSIGILLNSKLIRLKRYDEWPRFWVLIKNLLRVGSDKCNIK